MRLSSIACIVCITFAISCTPSDNSSGESKDETSEEKKLTKDERMEWWRDATFGMFIHWGPYAVPAGTHNGEQTNNIAEWIMNDLQIPIEEYEKYSASFNPTKFDAAEWVRIAKDAGMKYIIITSKHHDGFGLWDSEVSDYDIMDFSPYQQDILKALSDACAAEGIKFGLYHSIMDWHHPQAQAINEPKYWYGDTHQVNPEFPTYLETYMKPQLKELIENYNPAVLWFDGEWIPDYTHEQGVDVHRFVMDLKPDIIVNNRVDKGRRGMQGMNAEGEFVGDFGTPEQEILETTSAFDWESCMTMNDTWGYNQNDDNWKSSQQLVFNLVDVTAKGGNYLLNVGPTAEGLIPQASVERLAAMGDWMNVNSEAIYGTAKLQNTFGEGDEIRYTRDPETETYYGIKLSEPGTEVLFSALQTSPESEVKLLGYDGSLDFGMTEEGLRITIPDDLDASAWEASKAWVFRVTNASERM